MHPMATRQLRSVQRGMALIFFALAVWFLGVALGLIDGSTLAYSRCRTCPRVVTASQWTISMVGAMFTCFSVAVFAESLGTMERRFRWFGGLGWILFCAALARHAIYSDDPEPVRVWTGALSAVFLIAFITIWVWSTLVSRARLLS